MEKGELNCECKQCGKKFHLPPSAIAKGQGKYCSMDCKAQWQSVHMKGENNRNWTGGKVEMKCEICGTTFLRGKYEIDDGKHKFCSRKCFGVWMSKHLLGHKGHGRKKELKTEICEYCGEAFDVRKSSTDPNRFCSRACYGKWRSENSTGTNSPSWRSVERFCEQCGKPFWAQPNQIENNKGKFCSKKCLSAWVSENMRGENHPSYLGDDFERQYSCGWTETLKEKVRARDNNTCVVCGKPQGKRKHDVHHVDYVKSNLSTRNLVTLCRSCHLRTNHNRDYWQYVFAETIAFITGEHSALGVV